MGFSEKTLHWLGELEKNNDRDWFKAHKKEFEKATIEPMLGFIEELQPRLTKISPHYQAVAKKSGGSLMRIYRDTRFSKDKTPYNPYLRARLLHVASPRGGPGFYLHIGTDKVVFGAGAWHPESKDLARIREALDKNQTAWREAVHSKTFQKELGELAGESLKRPPRGYSADHPLIDDLKRKDFAAFAELPPEACLAKDLAARAERAWKAGAPLVKFLCQALELPF